MTNESELQRRIQAIQDCCDWLNRLQGNDSYCRRRIVFKSTPYGGMGVFATQTVKKGEDLIAIPSAAILRERNNLLAKSKSIQRLLDELMERYYDYTEVRFAKDPSLAFDIYRYSRGRIFQPGEVRKIALVTLLLVYRCKAAELAPENTETLPQQLSVDLQKATQYWSPLLDTWPCHFNEIPFLWTEEELELLGQNSVYRAKASRMKCELQENWENVLSPTLRTAGINIDDTLLHIYHRAAGAVYSRSHGHEKDVAQSRAFPELTCAGRVVNEPILCPLIDLLNGCRPDGKPNVMLQHYNKGILVTSLRTIQKGEEIIVSYGDFANSDYFIRFGFIPVYDGKVHLHKADLVTFQAPPEWLPLDSDEDCWGRLILNGFTKERLTVKCDLAFPFGLYGDSEAIYQCRYDSHGHLAYYLNDFLRFFFLLKRGSEAEDIHCHTEHFGFAETRANLKKLIDRRVEILTRSSDRLQGEPLQSLQGKNYVALQTKIIDVEIVRKWKDAISLNDVPF